MELVLAVPVASASALADLAAKANCIVSGPQNLMAVGQHYRDFEQVKEAEVMVMLAESDAAP